MKKARFLEEKIVPILRDAGGGGRGGRKEARDPCLDDIPLAQAVWTVNPLLDQGESGRILSLAELGLSESLILAVMKQGEVRKSATRRVTRAWDLFGEVLQVAQQARRRGRIADYPDARGVGTYSWSGDHCI
jgi:hypothetical protein